MLTRCFDFLHTQGMGWMVAGVGAWLLELALLGPAAAALVTYLRRDSERNRR